MIPCSPGNVIASSLKKVRPEKPGYRVGYCKSSEERLATRTVPFVMSQCGRSAACQRERQYGTIESDNSIITPAGVVTVQTVGDGVEVHVDNEGEIIQKTLYICLGIDQYTSVDSLTVKRQGEQEWQLHFIFPFNTGYYVNLQRLYEIEEAVLNDAKVVFSFCFPRGSRTDSNCRGEPL